MNIKVFLITSATREIRTKHVALKVQNLNKRRKPDRGDDFERKIGDRKIGGGCMNGLCVDVLISFRISLSLT